MFRIFESILDPTAEPPVASPPDRLVAFYWHFIRQSRFLVVALLAAGMLAAVLDSMIPAFIGRLVTLSDQPSAGRAVGQFGGHAAGHGGDRADRPAGRAAAAQPDHQPGHHPCPHQPDPLAEPLERGAAILDVLPERFRRPGGEPGDAGGSGAAGERGQRHQRRLVHHRLWRERHHPDGPGGLAAGGADGAVVRLLCRGVALCTCR